MPDLVIPRGSGPLPLLLSVAAFCAASATPFWSGHIERAPRLIDDMVAAPAVLLALLLAAMVRLAVLDWLAERQSHRAWTAIGARPDNLASTPVVDAPAQRDHPYVPLAPDAAVWDILRAHRHAVPLGTAGPESDAVSTDVGLRPLRCEPQDSLLPRAAFIAEANHADEIRGRAASAIADRVDLRRDGKVRCRRRVRFATEAGRVVNAACPSPHRGLRVLGIPIRIVSDIVVVGQGENELPPGDPPQQQLNGSTTRPFIAVAEARRQIVALAEALARQAAREDDATEAAEERSRSPPHAQAEQSPSRGAKDTS
jgi:hypothetical protein